MQEPQAKGRRTRRPTSSVVAVEKRRITRRKEFVQRVALANRQNAEAMNGKRAQENNYTAINFPGRYSTKQPLANPGYRCESPSIANQPTDSTETPELIAVV